MIALNGPPGCGHHGPVIAFPMPLVSAVPRARVPESPEPEPQFAEGTGESMRLDVIDDDDDLVDRLRAGERAAVEAAYVAHHAAIRGFARRLVGDDSAAEDIVHE